MALAKINGLPLYRAEVNGSGEGIEAIALVDFPAVMSDFIAFAEQKPEPRQMYAVSDEEKRLVLGVIMRADFPIYRIGRDDYEYYIYYSPEVIRQMAQKYLADGRSNEVNIMHDPKAFVEGVEMVQWFIKDAAAGIAPEGFADISDGSLFAEFHISNDDVWEAIKGGTFRGFSLEGYFSVEPETSQEKADAMAADNKGKFSKIIKNLTMSKLDKIKAALAAILAQYGSVATDKGVLNWDGEEDLKAGDKVFTEGEDGQRAAVADGEYVTEDGKTIVVVDGSVSEIRDPEAEVEGKGGCEGGEDKEKKFSAFKAKVAAKAATYEEKYKAILKAISSFDEKYKYGYIGEASDESAVICWWNEEAAEQRFTRFSISFGEDGTCTASAPKEVKPSFISADEVDNPDGGEEGVKEAVEGLRKEVDELFDIVDKILKTMGTSRDEIESLRNANAELRAQVEKLAGAPASEGAHESFEAANGEPKSGAERAARIASARL